MFVNAYFIYRDGSVVYVWDKWKVGAHLVSSMTKREEKRKHA